MLHPGSIPGRSFPEAVRSDTAKRDGRESRKEEEEDKGKPPRAIKIDLVHHFISSPPAIKREREDEDLLFFNRQPTHVLLLLLSPPFTTLSFCPIFYQFFF